MIQKDINKISNELAKYVGTIKDFENLSISSKIELIENELKEALLTNKISISDANKSEIIKSFIDLNSEIKLILNLLDNETIEEIMINGTNGVFVKYRFDGTINKTDIKFDNDRVIYNIIEKLLESTGRRVDKSEPMVDAKLADGSRINVILPPLSSNGPVVTIRKFSKDTITLEKLVELETIDNDTKDFLLKAVDNRSNILIAGGTSSGKTTTLNAIASKIPKSQRIVIIEETTEIKLHDNENVINLETRIKNFESKGEVSIRDLVKNSLRMRPDRLIVGEVRSEEAFDMLQAINTGHPGSITTIHANSAQDALSRLEALIMLSGFKNLSQDTIKNWISSSIDLVIYQKNTDKGERKVVEISCLDNNFKAVKLFDLVNGKYNINKSGIEKFLLKSR